MPERSRTTPVALAVLLGVILCVVALVGIGGEVDPVDGLAWVLTSAVYAGGPAAVYLLAAMGYGILLAGRLVKGEGSTLVRGAIGLAFMLTASHGLGALGLLTPGVARAVCAIGFGAIIMWFYSAGGAWFRSSTHAGPGWAAIPAGCVLFIAASCPPSTLWGSEFGGYDALSYHLQLPQEWLAAGRLQPLEHNVYSFLPSYVESAYLHLAALVGTPTTSTVAGEAFGLMAGDGWAVLSCQWLHAGLTLYAAFMVGGLARMLARRAGHDDVRQRVAGSIAAGLTLATPWIVVVGSLAYNEMAVVALGAGAVATALIDDCKASVRGALVGALVGVACGAKPTAMFMIAPVAGLMLLWAAPRRAWVPAGLACAAAGLLALSPWMVRDAMHGGNPLFPYATSLFGTAHWTSEQAVRFASGHHFDGSLLDRLRVALWTNPATSPGDRAVERFRGVSNPQWGILFFAAAFAAVATVFRWWRGRSEHRTWNGPGLMLVIGLSTQLAAWLFLTHIQSRFLLPCIVTCAPLLALGCATMARRSIGTMIGVVVVAAQMGVTVWVWSQQLGGAPTGAMIAGVRTIKGEPFVPELHAEMPAAATGHIAGLDKVYLLGASTPLYFSCPVLYHTTWDTSPLGELMRARPDDPWGWAETLRSGGVVFVLADYAELTRLGRSGWYDADVTPESVMHWLDEVAEPLVGWSNYGQMLYRLKENP